MALRALHFDFQDFRARAPAARSYLPQCVVGRPDFARAPCALSPSNNQSRAREEVCMYVCAYTPRVRYPYRSIVLCARKTFPRAKVMCVLETERERERERERELDY